MDIKPGSCPNSFNRNSNGRLPVVEMIDVDSVELARADGVGGSVMPLRTGYVDVGTPFDGEPCECDELDGDGDLDLTFNWTWTTRNATWLACSSMPSGGCGSRCGERGRRMPTTASKPTRTSSRASSRS